MRYESPVTFKFKLFSTPKKSKMRQNSKMYLVATIFENNYEIFDAKIDKIAVFYTTFWRRKSDSLGGQK